MAELNDKLISYGNLSTFYDKLQEQGLGGNTIEEVSELPEAFENKDKLVRLDNGEKDVYAAKLLSSTVLPPTNRLPDAQQIDKAYLHDVEGYTYYYKGAWKFIVSDGEIDGYGWYSVIEDIAYVYVALDDAENTTSDTVSYIASFDEGCIFDLENHTVTNLNYTLAGLENDYKSTFSDSDIIPILATYNAPESAQIGNAYIYTDDNLQCVYTGEETTIEVDGETINVYKWYNVETTNYSTKRASEIYYSANVTSEGNLVISDTIFYMSDGTPDSVYNAYIPQLNAPDSEQVHNAYLVTSDYNGTDTTFKYTGEQVTLIGTNGSFTGYKWKATVAYAANEIFIFSTVNANNIYCDTTNSTENIWYGVMYDEYDSNNNVWGEGTVFTSNSDSISFYPSSDLFDGVENPELSTVKYQRTEVTEEWDWEKVATEQYVDDAIATIDVPEYSAGDGIAIDSANTISCTVNAKDSEQIGVAYLEDDADEKIYYDGTEVTINASNGTFTGYAWLYSGQTISDLHNVSVIKAEQIEDDTALFYATVDISYVSGTTFSHDGNLVAYPFSSFVDDGMYYNYYIKQNSFTEKILSEVKGWKNEYSVTGNNWVHVDGTRESIVASGNTVIIWDNLALSIPSGKTVEVIVVAINTSNSARQITMSGHYQMMGDGNITIQPNELGLYRGTYISALSKWLVEAINQEVSGTIE